MAVLTCTLCGNQYPSDRLQTVCPEDGRPLRVDLDLGPGSMLKEALRDREPTMWRYREALPSCDPISLGEGFTPLHHAPRLGSRWYVKDEGVNPTASFKARGMSAAVSMAKHLGATKLAVPSAGNAGGALAAYAAKAGLEAHVFMPADTPRACIVEAMTHGADVRLIDGLINDCAAEIGKLKDAEGWFDMSTLKEPYRAEGKKTMGYELAEQMDWRLPDVVIYPTGGGTGLVGMEKAFDEMERMDWIGPERPRMVAVQAVGCAPIVTAFEKGERFADLFPNAHTAASGLRVPRAVGDFIMLDFIRATHGTALTVTDEEMIAAAREIARTTGIFAAPEGGATLAAARRLQSQGWLKEDDVVVLFNTGSGVKYLEALSA
ncbi:threonine synthase [Fimbriimonas ginsengisoli]|uniref:Threonine synthase n=1 Tax=Fimbriimonas ginsengisoli Gsoil 348 TaxID=661478 RepID=A0A068NT80_FIMGI|nr:threonine synthase [Fimbriimonas ginsengisoli]AIE85975.1 threonine synthase [Fimbriimonas ginsengisoli Gsoil 348]